MHAISGYLVAALVFPDITGNAMVDLRDHYLPIAAGSLGLCLRVPSSVWQRISPLMDICLSEQTGNLM